MPSQENELDGLLKELSREEKENTEFDPAMGEGQAPDLDTVAEMTEEEIEKRLSAGMQPGGNPAPAPVQEDVLDMLGAAGDEELQEIGDLLKKSDRNELIDGQEAEPGASGEKKPADRLLEDIEDAGDVKMADNIPSDKERKALEKKRRKEEKKAAREAARAEKKAKRQYKKLDGGSSAGQETGETAGLGAGKNEIEEYDITLDKDLLDNIVQEAGRLQSKKSAEPQEKVKRKTDVSLPEDGGQDDDSALTESGIMEVDFEQVDSMLSEPEDILREKEEPKEKGSLLQKVFNFLMEEEEEPENENLKLSKENQEILDGMGEEEPAPAKKKKAKAKPKKKKDNKAKKPKAPKPQKAPKPKKEKKPAEEESPFHKKLTFKKILPILLLGLSLGAVLFIFVNLVSDFSGKLAAEKAFRTGDYENCYLNLYGKDLNEEQEEMYEKSESILYMRLLYREYEMVAESGSELEILDCLIQIVNQYPTVSEYTARWGAVPEVYEIYSGVLNILYERYGVTEQQAQEIAALKSDIAYTRTLMLLTDGNLSGIGGISDAGQQQTGEEDTPEDLTEEDGELPNELPEESDLEAGDFVDNQ